jgi:uncharacterized protein (DUF2236 family)
VAWRVTSDLRLNVAMLYPLLLQVAHPTIDAGVTEYSDFERRPWDRLMRTMDYVRLLVYGGREAANAGRRLRKLHQRFRGITQTGTRYSALEPTAHAWPQFQTYFRRTARTTLEPTASLQRVLTTIHDVGAPATPITGTLWPILRLPASRVLTLGGIGLLDPITRRRLEISWSTLDEAQFRVIGAFTKRLGPLMPESLKVTGPGHLRWRSAEIADGPLGRAA